MKIRELKKEYQKSLKDFNKKDTKRQKEKFKNDCLQWLVEFYGVGSDEVLETMKELKKL